MLLAVFGSDAAPELSSLADAETILSSAREFLGDCSKATTFAQEFFQSELGGLGTRDCKWPPANSSRILVELASRQARAEDKHNLLLEALQMDEANTEIRKALISLLMQMTDAGENAKMHDYEGVHLHILFEEGVKIPTDMLASLSLQQGQLQFLRPEVLLELADQLSQAKRKDGAARVAALAGALLEAEGGHSQAHQAYLTACLMDRQNEDAFLGLVKAVRAGADKCHALESQVAAQREKSVALEGQIQELSAKLRAIQAAQQGQAAAAQQGEARGQAPAAQQRAAQDQAPAAQPGQAQGKAAAAPQREAAIRR